MKCKGKERITQMLQCENYKMFKGTMTIIPKCEIAPFNVTGIWLYKPDVDTWYCKGHSYPAEICAVFEDFNEE